MQVDLTDIPRNPKAKYDYFDEIEYLLGLDYNFTEAVAILNKKGIELLYITAKKAYERKKLKLEKAKAFQDDFEYPAKPKKTGSGVVGGLGGMVTGGFGDTLLPGVNPNDPSNDLKTQKTEKPIKLINLLADDFDNPTKSTHITNSDADAITNAVRKAADIGLGLQK